MPVDTWPTTRSRLSHEHRSLVDAVIAGDAELARNRIVDHIRGYCAEGFAL